MAGWHGGCPSRRGRDIAGAGAGAGAGVWSVECGVWSAWQKSLASSSLPVRSPSLLLVTASAVADAATGARNVANVGVVGPASSVLESPTRKTYLT